MSEETWRRIIEIHQYAKDLMLLGEEYDPKHRTFLQPMKEQRDALEHIIRARSKELGVLDVDEQKNEGYIRGNYDKALGHEYRAFFDCADRLSIVFRETITKSVSVYSNQVLTAAFPDYYEHIRPKVTELCAKVAEVRGKKDISKSKQDELLEEVRTYNNIISDLRDSLVEMYNHIPALDECQKKEEEANIENHKKEKRAYSPQEESCLADSNRLDRCGRFPSHREIPVIVPALGNP